MDLVFWALHGIGLSVVALLFLTMAKKVFDLVTPYSGTVQLTEKDNPAVGVMLVGYLLGVIAVISGTFAGGGGIGDLTVAVFLADLREALLRAVLGMLLVLLAGLINDRIILRGIDCTREIIEKRNISVAAIQGTTFAGSGLIVAGAIHGSASLGNAIGAYALGQAALVIYALIYQRATSYDDQEELVDNQNLAVGLGFGGNMFAYSLLLMRGSQLAAGDFSSLLDRLLVFGYYALAGAVVLPLVRLFNDRVFLPRVRLSDEVLRERNTNAGFLEAALALAGGAILVCCL